MRWFLPGFIKGRLKAVWSKLVEWLREWIKPETRGLVVGACIGWSLIELVLGNSVWFALFFALGCYLGYEFFVMFDPADYEEKDDER